VALISTDTRKKKGDQLDLLLNDLVIDRKGEKPSILKNCVRPMAIDKEECRD